MENKETTDKEAKKLVERVSTAAFFLQGQIEQANRHYETAFHTLEASRRYLEKVEKTKRELDRIGVLLAVLTLINSIYFFIN